MIKYLFNQIEEKIKYNSIKIAPKGNKPPTIMVKNLFKYHL
jgi:hypothetical protein